MDEAVKIIPKDEIHLSRITLKATAGLRLIPPKAAIKILKDVTLEWFIENKANLQTTIQVITVYIQASLKLANFRSMAEIGQLWAPIEVWFKIWRFRTAE